MSVIEGRHGGKGKRQLVILYVDWIDLAQSLYREPQKL